MNFPAYPKLHCGFRGSYVYGGTSSVDLPRLVPEQTRCEQFIFLGRYRFDAEF
jgi:hypothetical protein